MRGEICRRRAGEEGPHTVARHGKEIAVVLGIEDYERLQRKANRRFIDFLRSMPELPAGLSLDPDRPLGSAGPQEATEHPRSGSAGR